MILAVKHFAVYLLGRKFLLQTDHKALNKLQTMNNDNPRLQRWSIALQQYQFDVMYKPGKDNTNADGLSRQSFPNTSPSEERGGV